MDWWTGLSVGVLAMSILIFAGDFIMQYWLAIRWGPTKTTDLVVERFQDKPTAHKVREALELPDRATVQAMTDKLKELELQLETKMIALEAKLDAIEMPDLAPVMAKLEEPFAFPADMVDDIADGIESRIAGKYGSELKAERKNLKTQAEELQAEYLNSPEWEAENKDRILAVQQHTPGKSYALARAAVKRGPKFVDSMARANLTRGEYKAFRELYDEIDNAPREDPVSAGSAGGWLTR